jgi:UDP-N-acetylmuramoylalanine--D-glutamate ligase
MPTNPAISEAVRNGALLTSEMEVFVDICPCKMIGVTGSDGKTTTTSIIAQLLRNEGITTHLGGNIGNPLLCDVDEMSADDIAVLELSSFQLVSMKKSPHIAVMTNLSPNHLDVHADMKEYFHAKRNIFAHQEPSDRVVFNFDNEFTTEYLKSAKVEDVLFFSTKENMRNGVRLEDGEIYDITDGEKEKIMTAADILIPGAHNIENFMAAFAAVRGLVSHATMRETALTFGGVEHRLELVRKFRGVSYYNDSIASSPSRAIAGLRSFEQKVILIAGGKDKGIPFDELGSEIISSVKTLVLTGKTAERIRDAVLNAPEYNGSPRIIIHKDFQDAVLAAADASQDGDIVILSPASTSYDRFNNFAERGEFFKKIVRELH